MMNRTFATLKNLNLIDSNSIFRHLTDEELAQIPIDQEPEFYKRGTIIYEEGSRIPGFFCVQKGIIKIYKTGFDGKEQIIRFAKKGDIYPEGGFKRADEVDLDDHSAVVERDRYGRRSCRSGGLPRRRGGFLEGGSPAAEQAQHPEQPDPRPS